MTLTATHETEETTMLLAYAVGGATDTEMHVKAYTWDGFCSRLMSPRVGNKDGSYYIRGGKLKANKRSDENLLEAELLILDADSTFDPVTGEVSSGAPPLHLMAERIKDMGLRFVAHTSHSARPQDGFWKYRIVFPAFLRSPSELGDCLDYIIAQLHGSGIFLADVVEARRWSQPWFLPRVRSEEDRAHFVAIASDGLPFDVSAALDWAEGRRKAEAQIHAAKTRHANPEPSVGHSEASAFGAFNDAASLDWVRDVLEGAGYRFGYFDRRQQCYRYMRPGSESGTCGVVVFKGSQGHWCTYSHHGSADPLSQKVSDPFELATILRFGGDRRAAARALLPQRPPEPSIVEQIASRQVEGEARPMNSVSSVSQGEPASVQVSAFLTSEQTKPADKQRKRVNLIPWRDLQDVPVRWLVQDILPAASFSAIYGRPGSYKSFVALHMAACVASGVECFGKPVAGGPVIYVAGEGGAGLKRRRDALLKHWKLAEDLPIYFVKSQLNMRTSLEDYDALCAAIDSLCVKPVLVIFDTFARIFAGGEENSAKDVGETIVILGAIQERYETAVAIIHHAGKDESRGMRGSSALLGAVDTELECVKVSVEDGAERIGKLSVTKQKDGDDGLVFGYRMETVSLSDIDADASSLALEPLETDEMKRAGIGPKDAKDKQARMSKGARRAFDILKNVLSEYGQTGVVTDLSRSVRCVKKSIWRDNYLSESPLGKGSANRSFDRAKESLWTSRTIAGFGEYVWISIDYGEGEK
jgi:hypothetical protein